MRTRLITGWKFDYGGLTQNLSSLFCARANITEAYRTVTLPLLSRQPVLAPTSGIRKWLFQLISVSLNFWFLSGYGYGALDMN